MSSDDNVRNIGGQHSEKKQSVNTARQCERLNKNNIIYHFRNRINKIRNRKIMILYIYIIYIVMILQYSFVVGQAEV